MQTHEISFAELKVLYQRVFSHFQPVDLEGKPISASSRLVEDLGIEEDDFTLVLLEYASEFNVELFERDWSDYQRKIPPLVKVLFYFHVIPGIFWKVCSKVLQYFFRPFSLELSEQFARAKYPFFDFDLPEFDAKSISLGDLVLSAALGEYKDRTEVKLLIAPQTL